MPNVYFRSNTYFEKIGIYTYFVRQYAAEFKVVIPKVNNILVLDLFICPSDKN